MESIITLEIMVIISLMIVVPLVVVIISLYLSTSKRAKMLDEFLISKSSSDLNT
jgi:hypothetical protein